MDIRALKVVLIRYLWEIALMCLLIHGVLEELPTPLLQMSPAISTGNTLALLELPWDNSVFVKLKHSVHE